MYKLSYCPVGCRPAISPAPRRRPKCLSVLVPALLAALCTLAAPARAALVVTEVMSSGSVADWFELTNTGSSVVDLNGYTMDDSSFAVGSSVPMAGVVSIAPGESVLFVEGTATTAANLRASWAGCVTNVRMGSYTGSGVGLSSGGDGVAVFDGGGQEQSRQTFGGATTNVTFFFTANNSAATLSANGVQGASSCASNSNVGSPGRSDGSVTAPGAPAVAAATGVGATAFTANWAAPGSGGAATGYILEVSADGFASVLRTQVLDAATTSVAVTGLTAGSAYGYRVHAVNRGGPGADSAVQQVTTSAGNLAPTTSLANHTAVSGVVGDAGDPMATAGLSFTVEDDATSSGSLIVSAVSSNAAVVPNDGVHLQVTHVGSGVVLKIRPAGVGYADMTVTVADGGTPSLSTTRIIHYAASANTAATASTRWYTGRSDASTAVLLADGTTMLVGDDEAPAADGSGAPLPGGNALFAYARTASGAPLAGLVVDNLTAGLGLGNASLQTYAQCVAAGYTGVENDNCKADGEIDTEASFKLGERVYVSGSHSNNKSGHSRPDRWRFFAVDPSGSGAATSLALAGYYKWMREDLRAWDHGNGHGLGADYLGLVASSNGGAGQQPEKSTLDGFSIEGMTTSPDDGAAWLAFRAPLVAAAGQPAVTANNATGRVRALIVPVTNFTALATASVGGIMGSAAFGAAIRLDLGGRGIREIRKNAANQYLIIAGPPDAATGVAPHDFRLYSWDGSVGGDGEATNLHQRDVDLGSFTAPLGPCSAEGLVALPANVNAAGTVDVVSDCGDAEFYGDGTAAKSLAYNAWKKFRVDQVSYASIEQLITFAPIGDAVLGAGAVAVSATGGASGNPVVVTSLTPGVCQVGGNSVTLVTVGACTLRATQAGNTSYAAATPVDRSFNVSLPGGTATVVSGSGQTGTVGGGTWVLAPAGTGVYQTSGFIATSGHPKSPPDLPAGYIFPHGLFDFVLINGAQGSIATLVITYPQALPAQAVYWKYGPTADNTAPHWYVLPEGEGPGTYALSTDRRTLTLTLADGGLGDDDLQANGMLVDQGGPAVPQASAALQPVPALDPRAIAALALAVSLLAGWMRWGVRNRAA